ncbi:MAG: hypothetical protein KAG14_00975 [Mycoplasmataceae bacterium]|nr:hypothetical protein [Mycoplasmataceae bacterium]
MKIKLISEITNNKEKITTGYETDLSFIKTDEYSTFNFIDPHNNFTNIIKFSEKFVSLTLANNIIPLYAHKETFLDILSDEGRISVIAKLMATRHEGNKYYIKYGMKSKNDIEIVIYEIYLYII